MKIILPILAASMIISGFFGISQEALTIGIPIFVVLLTINLYQMKKENSVPNSFLLISKLRGNKWARFLAFFLVTTISIAWFLLLFQFVG